MILVLCEPTDISALWAAFCLRERGLETEVVTTPALDYALRWEHRVGCAGARVQIELADGRCLSSDTPAGVLNRIGFVPTERLNRIAGTDRDYALMEMNALFLSWLHALPGPVINRPTPQGLSGNWRHPSLWAALAGQAGLPVAPYAQSDETAPESAWSAAVLPADLTAFVLGSRVIAPSLLPNAAREGCRRLARAAGETLLGVDFGVRADGEWEMLRATPAPDLIRGGPPLVEALAEALAT